MKKFTVASSKSIPKRFQPDWFANKLLLASGFSDGQEAHIRYAHGKLTIIVGKKPKALE